MTRAVNVSSFTPTNWTTAGRPSNPSTGQVGYNTTLAAFEIYNGSAWTSTNGVWTTATRPSSPVMGMLGYNTTTGQLEIYNTAGGWANAGTSGSSYTATYLIIGGAIS